MKFQLPTVLALLPALALTMPTAEAAADIAETISDPVEVEARDTSPEALGLVEKRSTVVCKIVNSSSDHVNCRSGPGFDYSITARVYPGTSYSFNCYKSGDCYNGNCTWQRINWDGKFCYVNGYYTDSRCTAAALGKC
ncbi:uncharacterized protein BDV17DRAFT_296230 [Aspergillus undulatus]|uniref:uncharacterized protein n=1 Tax=Aspergillus undulatus TaxID=1810928 RepID=UPI003CCDD5FE